MEYNDIDIDFFDFFTAFDKINSLGNYLKDSSQIISNLDTITDDSNVIDDALLSDSISKLKTIVDGTSGEIVNFISEMENTKEIFRGFPDADFYFEQYDLIKDELGEEFFVNGGTITSEMLEVIYPGFKDLSPERKILIYDFLKYVNMDRTTVMHYSGGWKNNYNGTDRYQIKGTTAAWCAYSAGGIIEYRFGKDTIFDGSYASVYKIVGNWNDQVGIAFSDDERKRFVLSSGSVNILENDVKIYNNWEKNISKYNTENGTNLETSDWIDESYEPISGDLIIFDDKSDGELPYLTSDDAYSHVGMVLGVREVDGVMYVDTIEGNVNNSVQLRTFHIDDPSILGYCNIKYEEYNMVDEYDPTRVLTDEEIREIESRGIEYFTSDQGELQDVKLSDVDFDVDKFRLGNTR